MQYLHTGLSWSYANGKNAEHCKVSRTGAYPMIIVNQLSLYSKIVRLHEFDKHAVYTWST